jgi:hypothetical protein
MFDQPSQPVSHHAARCCGGLEDPDKLDAAGFKGRQGFLWGAEGFP